MESEGLAHFGVKGMKWGVRKEDPNASTESRALRKESKKNVRKYILAASKNDYLFNWMTQEEYDALSTKGETLVKNTLLHRVAKDDFQAAKGNIYVSKLLDDHDYYKAAIPAYDDEVKKPGGGQKKYALTPYDVELRTVNKLSLPSEKERVDAFKEILSKPAIKVEGKTAPITGRQYLENMGYRFKRGDDHQYALRWYKDVLVPDQGNQDNPLNQAYFNVLKEKGYNALRDDNDSGRVTKDPYIVLDAERNVKVSNVRKLNADEINQAQRRLRPKT